MVEKSERAVEEQRLRKATRAVARPDSRYQYDLDCFIPDFPGSEAAALKLRERPDYHAAQLIFATPDNALIEARRLMLEDGKSLIAPTYGLTLGFLFVDPAQIPAEALRYAAWLDGIAHFGAPVSLDRLRNLPRVDFIVAGAAAVARNGVRFGMGYHYLDVEWGLLAGMNIVTPQAPVISIVHDCQYSPLDIAPTPFHVGASAVLTPTAAYDIPSAISGRPTALAREIVPGDLAATDILQEYVALKRS